MLSTEPFFTTLLGEGAFDRAAPIPAAPSLCYAKVYDMTLSNDPNPSDENRPRDENRHPQEGLSLPSVPRAFHHRMLANAYLRNCRLGFVERFELITHRPKMEYEDRVILDRMESKYRQVFQRKLEQFGLSDKGSDVTVRVLHPVVAIGKTRREYHLYLDVVSQGGRCWFVDFDTAARFENGPAALQLSSLGPGAQKGDMVVTRLLSVPAFQEALEKLANAPYSAVLKDPRGFVAFGWIVQAIATARNQQSAREYMGTSSAPRPIPLSQIADFQWTGETKPFTFECCVGNGYYIAQVRHHPRSRQPFVALHEELF